MKNCESEIKFLPGVGPRRAELLEKELEIKTLGDLLRTYPYRYIDRSTVTRIADVVPDVAYVQVVGTVTRRVLYGPSGSIWTPEQLQGHYNAVKRLSVMISDGTGEMELVFFKAVKWNYDKLVPGSSFVFFGKPSVFSGRINIVHPEVDQYNGAASAGGTLTGVYSSTERLRNAGITGKMMTKMMAETLEKCLGEVEENLPDYVMKEEKLCTRRYALRNIHFPENAASLEKAQYRLKFEELFFLQLSLLKQKYVRCRAGEGIRMTKVGEDFNLCYNSLPYSLTGAQKRVIKEIREDMRSGRQMNRLLQGDVGSGKTMVAVLSSLIAVGNGYQACMMAPTEVLAEQHYNNMTKYLRATGVKVALLTGRTGTKDRRTIHGGLMDGSIGIIIGTHALIEDSVQFKSLGLAVIDEQHRFGVEQRAGLWNKGPVPPHVLVMTATPIPRTLAMTLYGDLDVSVIDEMPPGRKPVETIQIGQGKRWQLYNFMKKEIAAGKQVFVVYPLIFESEKLDLHNLETGYDEIMSQFPLPQYKVAMVHGQQSGEEKDYNMSAFAGGRADILVSTTVIEVGVDVPNASVMVIESAERFGLSQLHQLRGRVGRGSEKSYCILIKDPKISRESQKRLDLLCSTQDGFTLAEEDMKMRGPGDMEGTQQSGLPIKLGLASLSKDAMLLSHVRDYADRILAEDPGLELPVNDKLLKELGSGKYAVRDFSNIS